MEIVKLKVNKFKEQREFYFRIHLSNLRKEGKIL